MSALSLNAKEIMCIAAGLGISEIYGIPDGFRDVSSSRLRSTVQETQQSLAKKGVLSLDFDGNASITPSCLRILEVMLRCERFIAVDRQRGIQGQDGFLFYLSGDAVVSAIRSEDEYLLELITEDTLCARVRSLIRWTEDPPVLSEERAALPQRTLAKAKASAQKTASILTDAGLSLNSVQIIQDAFSMKTNFYSMSFANLTAQRESLRSIMFIDNPRGTIQMRPIVIDDVNHIEFTATNQKNIQEELEDTLGWFFAGDEVSQS